LHLRNLDRLRSHCDKRFPLLANVAGGTHVANGTALKKAVRTAFNPRKKPIENVLPRFLPQSA
jgi:hypothetical protein